MSFFVHINYGSLWPVQWQCDLQTDRDQEIKLMYLENFLEKSWKMTQKTLEKSLELNRLLSMAAMK